MMNSWGVVAAKEMKELNSSRKTEKGLQKVEDEGGRWILKTDIFEWGSFRVTEATSKEENSLCEVGSCVKNVMIKFKV